MPCPSQGRVADFTSLQYSETNQEYFLKYSLAFFWCTSCSCSMAVCPCQQFRHVSSSALLPDLLLFKWLCLCSCLFVGLVWDSFILAPTKGYVGMEVPSPPVFSVLKTDTVSAIPLGLQNLSSYSSSPSCCFSWWPGAWLPGFWYTWTCWFHYGSISKLWKISVWPGLLNIIIIATTFAFLFLFLFGNLYNFPTLWYVSCRSTFIGTAF